MKKHFLLLILLLFVNIFCNKLVSVIQPKEGVISIERTYYAKVVAENTVNVGSKYPGRVIKTMKKEGDPVKVGEVLYTLDRELTGMQYNLIEEISPINGIIVKQNLFAGQFISPGLPVYIIVNTRDLNITINICPERTEEINGLKYAHIIKNDEKHGIKLERIIPYADHMSGMVPVIFKTNFADLIPHEVVEVKIIIAEARGIVLPLDLILNDGKDYLFKYIDGKAVKTYIELGLKNDYHALVISGTEKNDIIIQDSQIVRNGEEVRLRK